MSDPDALPLQIEQFLRSSKKGTVVVWMGANYGSDVMPEEKQRMFIGKLDKIYFIL